MPADMAQVPDAAMLTAAMRQALPSASGLTDKPVFRTRGAVLANAFASAEMCAVALGCDRRKVGIEIGERAARHYPAELVNTAPCKEVIVRGAEVDLTMLPLFSHHPLDGQAYINSGRVVTRDPDTGAQNDGIQRLGNYHDDRVSPDPHLRSTRLRLPAGTPPTCRAIPAGARKRSSNSPAMSRSAGASPSSRPARAFAGVHGGTQRRRQHDRDIQPLPDRV